MMTPETKAKLDEWRATRPAFQGTVTRQAIGGKAERRTAKRAAVRKAARG